MSYEQKLERSGCTQVSELSGCDINMSKAENAAAGFGAAPAAASASPYTGNWVATFPETGATVANIQRQAGQCQEIRRRPGVQGGHGHLHHPGGSPPQGRRWLGQQRRGHQGAHRGQMTPSPSRQGEPRLPLSFLPPLPLLRKVQHGHHRRAGRERRPGGGVEDEAGEGAGRHASDTGGKAMSQVGEGRIMTHQQHAGEII